MKKYVSITLSTLTPIALVAQSETGSFIEYSLTKNEQWLDSAYFSRWYQLPEQAEFRHFGPLTDNDYREVAAKLGVEVAAIKAVVDIETGRKHDGFWKEGVAIINFDSAIYRQYARSHNVDVAAVSKSHPIIFRSPNVKKYGSKQAAQYARLHAAMEVDKELALESCFWGMFQIGGFNWKLCGCKSVDEFCMLMNRSERDQLELFAAFCSARNLVRFIKSKNWEAFSLRYNGPGYKKLGYHIMMENAYNKFKQKEKQ